MTTPVPPIATVALLALSVALAGCASDGHGPLLPGPDRAEATLGEAEITAIGEILMLEDHRRYDDAAFRRHLGSTSVEVRRRAVTAAGRIGNRGAVALLMRALAEDPAAPVRADAAFALGELGDTSAAVIAALDHAVPSYWVPVREPEVAIVVEILGALGKLGTPAAGRLVGAALLETNPALRENTRRVAAEALLASWRFGEATPVPRIAAFLEDEDPGIRWRAAYALSRSGRSDGVPYLLGRVGDPEHRVRAYAVRGLARDPARAAGVADSARALLAYALGDPHPHVRINALGALASHQESASVADMAPLLRDEDPNVAVAAAAALGRLGRPAADALAAGVRDASLPGPVRGAALAALAAVDPGSARPLVAGWAAGDQAARWYAARALASLGWDTAREVLTTLAADPDPRVAIAAIEAAGTLAADSALPRAAAGGIRAALTERTGADDLRVATVAAAALAPVATSAETEPLLALYGRAAGLGTPSGRAAAIAALEALGALGAERAAAASSFFRRYPAPPDRWVHRVAADTLGPGWGMPPAAVASDDPAFYADIARRYIADRLEDGEGPIAVLSTAAGTFEVRLLATEAPLTVANFVDLASSGYYDAGVWHRVVPNFVLQDGAPAGYASGGPGWAIRDEINRVRYERGTMGMALSGPDTGGSQWFITHSPQPHLDGGYTVFGRVVEGMDVADRVVQGDAIHSIRIRR